MACVALLCFAAGGLAAANHPAAPLLALAAFYTLSLLAAWRPGLWLFAVPAGLPFLNFAPWTGWLMVDEFDLLLMAVLAGAYGRMAMAPAPREAAAARLDIGSWLPAAVLLAGAVALCRGFSAADAQAISWYQAYNQPLNSPRVFKSLLWAGLCVPLLRDTLRHAPHATTPRIAGGMAAGLACVVLAVLWERLAFPGLLDFTSRYRITALFWEMHVGGAAIDAYLALALPFVVWALRSARGPWGWLAAALLAVLATYACLTTFSRGVYLAVGAPLVLLGGLLWMQARGLDARQVSYRFWARLRPRTRRAQAGWLLSAALLLEVIGVLHGGSYMADRIAATDRDFGSRLAHWQRGLSLLEAPGEWLLGRGLGRLPALYAETFLEGELPGEVNLRQDSTAGGQEHRYVTVRGPRSDADLSGLFALTQRVSIAPGERFRAHLHVRLAKPADVYVQVCERHLLYNGGCQTAYARLVPGDGRWQDVALFMRGRPLRGGPWYAPRPVVFAVSVLDPAASVDIDRVSLLAQGDENRLQNADFAEGLAHWFPSAQSYFLPWHIDNLYLELLIERGWLGLALTLTLIACALWRLVLGVARGHTLAPYIAASLSGVMVVGLVSSVMDVPRVAFLFFWLAFFALQLREPRFEARPDLKRGMARDAARAPSPP
ncbi:MAG: hypothetical protein JWP29_4662 [Rhodoferax sp.]|nr:hypothetical protein [Rhodoferax sp.]